MIAVFYAHDFSFLYLSLALGIFAILLILNRLGVQALVQSSKIAIFLASLLAGAAGFFILSRNPATLVPQEEKSSP